MTYPITPKPTIHELTPALKQKQNLAMSQQVEAMAKQMVGGIVNAILQILTGGTLGGEGTHNGIDLFGNLFNNLFKTLGITDPAGILAQIEQDLFDVEQVLTHWVDNILSPLNLVLDGKTWQGFIDDILGGFENSVTDLAANLKKSIAEAEKAVGQIVQMVASTGQQEFAGLLQQLSTMLTSISSLGGPNILGTIPTDVLHVLDLGSVNQTLQELTGNGTFLSDNAIDAKATAVGITWDKDNGKTVEGSAKFAADGTTKSLFSNPITVTEGQQLSLSAWIKWASLGIKTGTTTPIELNVAKFHDGALVGYENIASAGTVGSNSTWVQLSGTYTAPAGVDRVCMKITLRDNAASGTVWFDEASMTRSGLLAGDWMNGIKSTVSADFQSIVDQIYKAVKGASAPPGQDLDTIITNFQYAWNKLFGVDYVNNLLSGLVIPALAASKLDPALGLLSAALFPDITKAMSSDLQGTINSIYNAVFGTNGTTLTPDNAKSALQTAWQKLFGYNYVRDQIWSMVIPFIDGGKLDPWGSDIPKNVVPDITRDMSSDIQNTIDAIYTTITGGASSGLSAEQAKQQFQLLMFTLFSQYSMGGRTSISPNAVPLIDGTKFDTGPGAAKLPVNAVPTTDVGKAILPGGGSGGMLVRTDTTPYACSVGRNQVDSGFWSYAQFSPTSDLYISGNSFVITTSGWYAVEISYAMNFAPAWGWSFAPVLFKNGGVFKVGGDVMGVSWGLGSGAQRYAQSTFVVYLAAGESVQAGYDMALGGFDPHLIKADATGAETYFGCSLISKNFN